MDPEAVHVRELTSAHVLDRVDKMVAAGRLTEEEGARLRAAARSGGLDKEVRRIRVRHAKARLESAVESGRVSKEQAQRVLERLDEGADPRIVLGLGAKTRGHPPVSWTIDRSETGGRHG